MVECNINELKERTYKIFKRAGLNDEDAKVITDVLATTEIRGITTHGFTRVSSYTKCLLQGGIKRKSELKIKADTPSWASVDGEGGLGIILSYKATKLAIEKAKQTGVGIVNVNGSHHFGAAGYYTHMCAEEGMFGMSMSNGSAMVAPTGGCSVAIGNNPFSYAAPAGKYGILMYDVAMSLVSDMKIYQLRDKGLPMPEGWAIRKDNGAPTTDPNDYCNGNGVLLPFGGHKGYGLALMVETLGAAMSGAAMLTSVNSWNKNPDKNGNVGHFFMALDINKIMPVNEFNGRMEAMIDELKAGKRVDPEKPILFPGELERDREAATLAAGKINILESTFESLAKAEKLLADANL